MAGSFIDASTSFSSAGHSSASSPGRMARICAACIATAISAYSFGTA